MADLITKTCRAIVKRGSEKPPHGGKRPGAGRPATAEKPKRDQSDVRTIRIPDHEWEAIKAAAAANGATVSCYVRDAAIYMVKLDSQPTK